jgi:hypothetical protein
VQADRGMIVQVRVLPAAAGIGATEGRRAVAADPHIVKPHGDDATAEPSLELSEIATAYIRRVYTSTREWYAVAEAKAQLLLTVNGAFVTILFGTLFGRADGLHAGVAHFGPETWAFLGVTVAALASALACAAGSLWSFHGRAKGELAELKVDPDNPDTYRPEALWYFGHLARLRPKALLEKLSGAGQELEATALSYNVIDLSTKVLRKHRLVNMGWALTALELIALIAAGTSFFIRAQL